MKYGAIPLALPPIELDDKHFLTKTKNKMSKSIPSGTYKVYTRVPLVSTFQQTTFVDVEVGKVLAADRPSSKTKTNWATTKLRAEDGQELSIDGLGLVKQCLENDELKSEVFGAKGLKASFVGSDLKIEVCNFKSEFRIAMTDGKFSL